MCAIAFGLLLLAVVLAIDEPTLSGLAAIVWLVVAYGVRGMMKPLESEHHHKNKDPKPVRIWGEFLGALIACFVGLCAAVLAMHIVVP